MFKENKTNDYLIVANGDFLSRSIIEAAAKNKTVVALDGAANRLAKIGIMPQVILGDFDSLIDEKVNYWGIRSFKEKMNDEDEPYKGNYNVIIVPAKDQNQTDLQKAIDYCCNNSAHQIDILCALGGRLDHQESNIRTLQIKYNSKIPIYLHNECQSLEFVRDKTVEIKGKIKDYCGVFALPSCEFKSENNGLEWSSDNGEFYKLKLGVFDSSSNSLSKEKAIVTVKGDALIIHPGMLTEQKKFYKLPTINKLEQLLNQERYGLVTCSNNQFSLFKKFKKEQASCLKDKNQKSIYYVSHSKEELQQSKDMNQTVMISMSPRTHEIYSLFSEKNILPLNQTEVINTNSINIKSNTN